MNRGISVLLKVARCAYAARVVYSRFTSLFPRQRFIVFSVAVALLLRAPLDLQLGRACAPIPRAGQFIRIAEESAIIAWDEKTRTQHFIRRATFDTDAPDFGFLVPTPSEPALAEVDNSAFDDLEYLIRPEVIENAKVTGFDFTPLLLSYFFLSRADSRSAPAAAVNVVSEQRVAGYDAAVLEADNAAALNRWLDKHGYASSPSVTEWLAPYIANRWKITAFKIAKDANYRKVGTSAVRMSFKTDRPFFPYREPSAQREAKEAQDGNRLLRVFFLNSSRVDGSLGDNASGTWPGQTVWADRISESYRERLSRLLPRNSQLAPNTWLSVLEDKSSPRPGTDEIYFAPSKQPGIVHLPPVVRTVGQSFPAPIDLILILILIVLLMALTRPKKRKKSAA
jgi:hypothetical protein